MNFKEAYSLLEIPETSSKEEAKKAFKKLAGKFHPDVCKEPDAEAKFKKINEAYQIIESGKSTDFDQNNYSSYHGYQGQGINIQDILNGIMGKQNYGSAPKYINATDIHLSQTISFKEAVTGCKKEVKYTRNIACHKCDGQGSSQLDNGCKTCNGKGRVINQRGSMLIDQSCPSCLGNIKTQPCSNCNSSAFIKTETSIAVNIPPGISSGNILRLGGMGNFAGAHGYTSVLVTLNVSNATNLKIQDKNVITEISISLLEALQGCRKKVPTIDGDKEIIVIPLSKNRDEIIIPRLGVARTGNEIVYLNIDYPTDCKSIIDALKQKEN